MIPRCRPTRGLARSWTMRTASTGAAAQATARTQSRNTPTANTTATPTSRAESEPTAARSWAQPEAGSAGKAAYPQTSSRLDQGRWTKARPATAATPEPSPRPTAGRRCHPGRRHRVLADGRAGRVPMTRGYGSSGPDVRVAGGSRGTQRPDSSSRLRSAGVASTAWLATPRSLAIVRWWASSLLVDLLLVLLELESLRLEQRLVADVGDDVPADQGDGQPDE